jgi:hypothetical protein
MLSRVEQESSKSSKETAVFLFGLHGEKTAPSEPPPALSKTHRLQKLFDPTYAADHGVLPRDGSGSAAEG